MHALTPLCTIVTMMSIMGTLVIMHRGSRMTWLDYNVHTYMTLYSQRLRLVANVAKRSLRSLCVACLSYTFSKTLHQREGLQLHLHGATLQVRELHKHPCAHPNNQEGTASTLRNEPARAGCATPWQRQKVQAGEGSVCHWQRP
jgi:hypothetical protein